MPKRTDLPKTTADDMPKELPLPKYEYQRSAQSSFTLPYKEKKAEDDGPKVDLSSLSFCKP